MIKFIKKLFSSIFKRKKKHTYLEALLKSGDIKVLMPGDYDGGTLTIKDTINN